MIKLYLSNAKIFVWDPKDVYVLREKYRIVGCLVGCYPIKPFQVQTKWLPLQLLSEEAKLLIDRGIAKLVTRSKNLERSSKTELYFKQRDKLCEEQVTLLKENRKKEILEKADQIYEGKKRKHLVLVEQGRKKQKIDEASSIIEVGSNEVDKGNVGDICEIESNSEKIATEDMSEKNVENETVSILDSSFSNKDIINKDDIIEAEISKIQEVPKELCMVQLFTESLWDNIEDVCWTFPSTEQDEIRLAVFKDLWEKGYYITAGSKFGGDFLAYEGDPLKYHATFIVICLSPFDKIQGSDIVMYGRLSHQVKKVTALASLNEDKNVEYLSLEFENKVV